MFTDLIAPGPTAANPDAPGPAARARFLRLLESALHEGQLSRLVLSQPQVRTAGQTAQPADSEAPAERVTGRLLPLRGVPHLQLVHRHATRDITRNHTLPEALALIDAWLGPAYRNAHVLTPRHELQFTHRLKGGRDRSLLRVGRLKGADGTEAAATADRAAPDTADASHNREKQRPLQLHQPWWLDLGLATPQGTLVPAMARKWKQINRFCEIVASALDRAGLPAGGPVRVADFGSGKAYLTFAIHELLRSRGQQPQVTGVELRAELVALCNTAAQRHGLDGLGFEAGDVRDYAAPALDAVIALHACDTATDHALNLGLRAGARLIVCSPCCHQELRPQFRTPPLLRPLLQHGVHLGQEAEMVTDSLRALLLDAMGYDTQVFEFISLEHTNKNKMILAVRRPGHDTDPVQAEAHARTVLAQAEALKQFYSIRTHRLQTLLQADGRLPA